MKVFLDANILVSVVNQEYPLFSLSSRILSLADDERFVMYTSPLCLAIAYYFAQKKSGNRQALKKIKILVEKLELTQLSKSEVLEAASDVRVEDFEDGMEYYSALRSGCEKIITEDVGDFYFSEIPVVNSETFVESLISQ